MARKRRFLTKNNPAWAMRIEIPKRTGYRKDDKGIELIYNPKSHQLLVALHSNSNPEKQCQNPTL